MGGRQRELQGRNLGGLPPGDGRHPCHCPHLELQRRRPHLLLPAPVQRGGGHRVQEPVHGLSLPHLLLLHHPEVHGGRIRRVLRHHRARLFRLRRRGERQRLHL